METSEEKVPAPAQSPRGSPSWLISFLRWGLVILIAFALGAALITFGLYLPQQQEYSTTKAALEEKETLLSTRLTELETMTSTNQTLEQELSDAELRAAILNALVAVQAARLAIAEENDANATLLISEVTQALDELAPLVTDKAQSEAVAAMQQKATLAQSTASGDMPSADATLIQLNDALTSLLETVP